MPRSTRSDRKLKRSSSILPRCLLGSAETKASGGISAANQCAPPCRWLARTATQLPRAQRERTLPAAPFASLPLPVAAATCACQWCLCAFGACLSGEDLRLLPPLLLLLRRRRVRRCNPLGQSVVVYLTGWLAFSARSLFCYLLSAVREQVASLSARRAVSSRPPLPLNLLAHFGPKLLLRNTGLMILLSVKKFQTASSAGLSGLSSSDVSV